MIGGRLDNTDAAERKKAFEDILASHGIEFSDRAYVSGNYSKDSIGVARTLLDNNPDLDAIFCVNDDTAFGLYKELNRRCCNGRQDESFPLIRAGRRNGRWRGSCQNGNQACAR